MPSIQQIIPAFKAEECFNLKHGIVFTGKSPIDFDEEDNPFPSEIIVNRKLYKVIGVNKYMHCSPWHAGESIAVLVNEVGK